MNVRRQGDVVRRVTWFLVPTPSAIKSIQDLAGKRVAYVDRFSSAGFVFPAKQLADAGVRVEAELRRIGESIA
jgi:ABC-type phosphate/phosphonate transport system substrate-binding protein